MVNKNKRAPKKQGTPKMKRWFIGASGWGLTLSAGSGNEPNGLKKREYPLSAASRILTIGGTVAVANFKHNTIFTFNLCEGINQGTADSNRLGDFIHLESACVRFKHDTTGSTNNALPVQIRVMLLASSAQYSSTSFGSGLGSSDIFLPGSSDVINQIIDPKRVKVLCDEIFTTTPHSNAANNSFYVACKIDTPFEYQTNGLYGTAANLYWVVIPDVTAGTSGTTTCGSLTYDTAIAFRSV